jgi:hypothetical protein
MAATQSNRHAGGAAMVVGPYRKYPVAGGEANLYLLRYSKTGALQSPQTFAQLQAEIKAEAITDVFLFSHGWNNTFDEATARYDSFITGYAAQREQYQLPAPSPYRPLLVGVIWPSTSFVMPWEDGPVIAAAAGDDSRTAEEMTRLLTEEMTPEDAARFAELVDGGQALTAERAAEAAALLAGALPAGGDEDGRTPRPSAAEVLASWNAVGGGDSVAGPIDPDDFGVAGDAGDAGDVGYTGAAAARPRVAGVGLDPRDLLRMGTVWKMHNRAGTVGYYGVSGLVQHVLNLGPSAPRLHMVGHSFGAKVVLSAISAGDAHQHKARSTLLLEPAINRWCFAPAVPGTGDPGFPGGYHIALDRIEQPILSTFSSHDHPLHEMFHLAVGSVGEMQIAAVRGTDRYGALGGYGPNGLGASSCVRPALAAGTEHYEIPAGVRVVGIDGGVELADGAAIKGHGDVSNPVTWWALHDLTGRGG